MYVQEKLDMIDSGGVNKMAITSVGGRGLKRPHGQRRGKPAKI